MCSRHTFIKRIPMSHRLIQVNIHPGLYQRDLSTANLNLLYYQGEIPHVIHPFSTRNTWFNTTFFESYKLKDPSTSLRSKSADPVRSLEGSTCL